MVTTYWICRYTGSIPAAVEPDLEAIVNEALSNEAESEIIWGTDDLDWARKELKKYHSKIWVDGDEIKIELYTIDFGYEDYGWLEIEGQELSPIDDTRIWQF